MTSKKDLEAQIKHLKNKMGLLEDRLKWLADYCFDGRRNNA